MEQRPIYLARIRKLTQDDNDPPEHTVRPVVMLTRKEILPAMDSVTVVGITRTVRNLSTEVPMHEGNGLDRLPCVINAYNVYTIKRRNLVSAVPIGHLDAAQEAQLVEAFRQAFGF